MDTAHELDDKQIIIADDSMFIIQQLSQILVSKGYTVAGTAKNGKEAIQCYKNLYPHVRFITMDITMPEMNGITALEQILKFDPKALVIMISALGTESLVKRALVLGARGYILKPLNRDKVLERIERALAR